MAAIDLTGINQIPYGYQGGYALATAWKAFQLPSWCTSVHIRAAGGDCYVSLPGSGLSEADAYASDEDDLIPSGGATTYQVRDRAGRSAVASPTILVRGTAGTAYLILGGGD